MAEIQDPTLGVAVVKKALPTLTTLPAILTENQISATRSVQAANALIAKCRASPKMTAELDKEVMDLIIKINDTKTKMEGKRKPGTQMMAEIAGFLIGEETKLKEPVSELQKLRDQRAREVVEDNRRKEREAAELARKNTAKAGAVAYFNKVIGVALHKRLAERKSQFDTSFNEITLANIEEKEKGMKTLQHAFPRPKLDSILVYDPLTSSVLDAGEIALVEKEVRDTYDFEAFYESYRLDLEEYMRGLIDRLPTKRATLLEAKANAERQEIIRQQQEENRKKQAELDRQMKEANSEKEKQQAAANKLRQEQETERLRLEQEKNNQETERLRLEEEGRQKELAQQKETTRLANERLIEQNASMKQTESIGGTLFDLANTAASKEVEGETRLGWKITITHAGGWAQIWQFWFMKKAADTPLDKFEKLTLLQMKSFCEDEGDTEKIESPFLKYEETFKAVNRTDKKSKKSSI